MDQKTLKELVHYDPESGAFTRLKVFHPRHKIGDRITSKGSDGLQLHFNGENYSLHRLAWLYMTGELPSHQVTTVNGDKSDTRWENIKSGKTEPREARKNNIRKVAFKDSKTAFDLLSKVFRYEPETGKFFYVGKVGMARRVSIGSEAGSVNARGYIRLSAYYREFLGHRLAFLLMLGEWPKQEVDHINGDRADNRWSNLRDVDRVTNMQNLREAHPLNMAGVLGAHQNARKYRKKRFKSTIKVDGKPVFLGAFATAEEAGAAYLKAKRSLHPGCTI